MMNKQEALKKIEKLEGLTIKDKDFNFDIEMIPKGEALKIVNQLDEPEKPVVPQFIADYVASEQCSCSTLSEAIDNMDGEERTLDWFYVNAETFAKAWLYGYEVEHEQQYVVAIPDERNKFIQLWKIREGKLLFNFEDKIRYGKVHLLTEKEIKQKDERLWQFAKEVEE